MSEIHEIKYKHSESGRLYLRNGIILAFFISKPIYEISVPLTELLNRFVQNLPIGTLKWMIASATSEEWKQINDDSISHLILTLAPEGMRKRKLTGFVLNDSGADAPGYSFDLVGESCDENFPDAAVLVQMTFPLEVLQKDFLETFVHQVRDYSEIISPTYGYCAPVLLTSELHREEAFQKIRGLVIRYPGYDVQMNEMTRLDIGMRVRGARWITFLGTELTERLGGVEVLSKFLLKPIAVERLKACVMIRAGNHPEIGDINRCLDTPLLRNVAKVLEPVTLFDEVDMLSNLADFDEEFLQRWEHRFLNNYFTESKND